MGTPTPGQQAARPLPEWLRSNPPAAPAARPGRIAPSPPPRRLGELYIALALLAGTFLLYLPTLSNAFVGYDDPQYVTQNPVVKQGPTGTEANWLSLTCLSQLAAVSLFGMNPAGHHAINASLHSTSAALLFVVLRSMTRQRWPSAVVAALFAVHPLHVESVAWVAERKDALSGVFFLLTLLAGMLVPVCGLIQVGFQSIADRAARRAALRWVPGADGRRSKSAASV